MTGHSEHSEAGLVELLDLDAAVLHEYWSAALAWVGDEAGTGDCSRILDLGAGTGTGAIGLAQRFSDAEVIALDVSEPMLEHIRAKARHRGLAARVRTLRADLDEPWPAVGPVDLTWASLSLHHLADPDRVLADLYAATRPGGVLGVAEMTEQVRFLPDELGPGLGEPGLELRLLDALRQEHEHALPHLGSDWAPRLAGAGFRIAGEREFLLTLDPPHPPAVADYAAAWLRRLRDGLGERLGIDDRAALDTLLGDGPASVRRRTDLRVHGSRTVTVARRS